MHVGLATWGTDASYRNAELFIDGKLVNISDYAKWNKVAGNWIVSDSEIMQTGNTQPAMIVCPEMIEGDRYTFKVQAKKNSGAEGFMAMVGYKNPDNYQWFNVGGWSNSQNNIEQSIGGNRVPLCRGERFSVENGRWYDLKVDVDGDSVSCYLDGKLNLSCKTLKGSAYEGVYASTTIDDAKKTMYVKVVNVGDGYADGVINLTNCVVDTSKNDALQLIRMSSASGSDENTIVNPHKVNPVEASVKIGKSNEILFAVSPYSVSIIKIPIK